MGVATLATEIGVLGYLIEALTVGACLSIPCGFNDQRSAFSQRLSFASSIAGRSTCGAR